MILQRQKEGIELAKMQGKYEARKKGTSKVSNKEFLKIHKQCQDGGITVGQAVKLLGFKSRPVIILERESLIRKHFEMIYSNKKK